MIAISLRELAATTGIPRTTIMRRAQQEAWPSRLVRCNGGLRRECLVVGLPDDIRTALTPDDPESQAAVSACDSGAALPEPRRRRPAYATFASAPERYRNIATHRAELLHAWQRRTAEMAVPLEAAVNPAWGVPVRTLWRWKDRYAAFGIDGLLPRWGGPETMIPEELWLAFLGVYLDLNQPSVQLAYERALIIYAEAHAGDVTDAPSVTAFHRRVRRLPRATLILQREGRKAYYDKAEPYLLPDRSALRANDQWVFDHHLLDFYCRDENGKPCRLWVTFALDVASRFVAGWQVCAKPSTDSILATLASGVRKYGAPWQGWMDNGKDFSSKEVSGGGRRQFGKPRLEEGKVQPMTEALGIEVHFSLPYNARAKRVERSFKTLANRFSREWKSYCGNSPTNRPETAAYYWAHPSECPSIHDVISRLAEWIDWYHKRVHAGRGMKRRTPEQVFALGQDAARRVDSSALSVMALRQARPQTVKRNGVSLFGDLWYWNAELHTHLGETVIVRYDSADLSRVHVFDVDGRQIATVERSELDGVTRADVGKALATQRRARKAAAASLAPRVDWKYGIDKDAPTPTEARSRASQNAQDMSALDDELGNALANAG
jgi:transposase InsO family protein